MNELERLAAAPDHFALFGLERSFALDEQGLQSRYLQLARLTHPDFAGSDPDQQLAAMELSARVNEAHRVLSDPEERANYLLDLLGGPRRDQDKSLPAGFLEEIMLLREELADAGGNPQVVEDARRRRQALLDRIAGLFSQASPAALKEIRVELNALRYIERLIEQL